MAKVRAERLKPRKMRCMELLPDAQWVRGPSWPLCVGGGPTPGRRDDTGKLRNKARRRWCLKPFWTIMGTCAEAADCGCEADFGTRRGSVRTIAWPLLLGASLFCGPDIVRPR